MIDSEERVILKELFSQKNGMICFVNVKIVTGGFQ